MKRFVVFGDGGMPAACESDSGPWVKFEDAQAAIQAAVEAEREACAKLAESTYEGCCDGQDGDSGLDFMGDNSAAAIRARGQS